MVEWSGRCGACRLEGHGPLQSSRSISAGISVGPQSTERWGRLGGFLNDASDEDGRATEERSNAPTPRQLQGVFFVESAVCSMWSLVIRSAVPNGLSHQLGEVFVDMGHQVCHAISEPLRDAQSMKHFLAV
jgi:hypothetical protein